MLVHEATFEDGMEEDAVKKRHSTVGEAVKVGTDAGAYRTVLTHFSQRYRRCRVQGRAEGGRRVRSHAPGFQDGVAEGAVVPGSREEPVPRRGRRGDTGEGAGAVMRFGIAKESAALFRNHKE